MFEIVSQWAEANQSLLWWLGISSVVLFVATLALVPIIVAKIPTDYFHPRRDYVGSLTDTHPIVRWVLLIIKNLIGGLFIVAGIAMLLLPGQGVLSILIGLSITDFPGKRNLERKIVGQPTVYRAIDAIRQRAGKASLEI